MVIFRNPSTENFTWPAYTKESENYVSINIPPRCLDGCFAELIICRFFRVIKGGLHFPAPSFWNNEVAMLSRYTLVESKLNDKAVSELTAEERIQVCRHLFPLNNL